MISIARTLGAPESVPAGKHAISASKQSTSGAQPPAQARRQMHHVRIALDEHQPLRLHRAVFADAAQVVAPQIDQHHVLGALLGIGQQLRLRASRSSSSLRPRGRVPASGR